MLPGEPCSSTSGLKPEKSTEDNPNEADVDEDDSETGQSQDSEMPKGGTVNDQQVEADQEHGDDHQAEKEELEEPTVSTPTRRQIACGLISSTDEEKNTEDEIAEENSPHSTRKRERESSEEENEEQEQENQELQGDKVEQQQEQLDGEGDNADQNPPANVPEQGGDGGQEEQEVEKKVMNEKGKAIAEEEKKDDGVVVDPKTLQTIVEKSGGSDHYDDSDSRDIEILKAMLVYQVHERRLPFNVELLELLKNSSEVEITEEELEMKYLVLQAKFELIVEEMGEGHVFDRPYCQEMFSLSKSLWGSGL